MITKTKPGPWMIERDRAKCHNYSCRNYDEPDRKTLKIRIEERTIHVECALCGKRETFFLTRRKEMRDCLHCKLSHVVIVHYWGDRDHGGPVTGDESRLEDYCLTCRAEARAEHYETEARKFRMRAAQLRRKQTRKIAGASAAPQTVEALDRIIEKESKS